MKNDSAYCQFPLSAFAYKTQNERLAAIVSYSIINTGLKLIQSIGTEGLGELRRESARSSWAAGANLNDNVQLAAIVGRDRLGITRGSMTKTIQKYRELDQFEKRTADTHGASPKVRLRLDIVLEVLNGGRTSYRELSVLGAVYSCIGSKPLCRVTAKTASLRALGYKSKAVFDAEFPNRVDDARPLSERQVNTTLQKLHQLGWYSRVTVARRVTYYSNRLSQAALEANVVKSATYTACFKRKQQESRDRVAQQIRDAIAKQGERLNCPTTSAATTPLRAFDIEAAKRQLCVAFNRNARN